MIFYCRGRKDQQCKRPDQAGIDEMNDQVYKMPITDIEVVEMIIKGKCEKADRTVRSIIPPGLYIG
jgi:hypothetical protein